MSNKLHSQWLKSGFSMDAVVIIPELGLELPIHG